MPNTHQSIFPTIRRILWSLAEWGMFALGCAVTLLTALWCISHFMVHKSCNAKWHKEMEALAPSQDIELLEGIYTPPHPHSDHYAYHYIIRFRSTEANERFVQEIHKRNKYAEQDVNDLSLSPAFTSEPFTRFRSKYGQGACYYFELYQACPYSKHHHPIIPVYVCSGEDRTCYVYVSDPK